MEESWELNDTLALELDGGLDNDFRYLHFQGPDLASEGKKKNSTTIPAFTCTGISNLWPLPMKLKKIMWTAYLHLCIWEMRNIYCCQVTYCTTINIIRATLKSVCVWSRVKQKAKQRSSPVSGHWRPTSPSFRKKGCILLQVLLVSTATNDYFHQHQSLLFLTD